MKKLITLILLVPCLSYGQITEKGTNGLTYTMLTQAQVDTAFDIAVLTCACVRNV